MTTYIKIFAGLCNRLFQYAYGKHLIAQGKKIRFIDADDGNTDILDVMNLGEDEKLFLTERKCGKIKIFLLKAFGKYLFHNYKIGFYQEIRFADCTDFKFRRQAEYEQSLLFKKISETESVSIHIRGGDYLDPEKAGSFMGICTKDYYLKAVSKVLEAQKDAVFFIFTNDRKYAEEIFAEAGFNDGSKAGVFVFCSDETEGQFAGDDGFDLFLMSRCRHNIIANSTFSWWGAYLNKNGSVICPEHWTNDGDTSRDRIMPDSWRRI